MLSAADKFKVHKDWLGCAEITNNLAHTVLLLKKHNLVDYSLLVNEFEESLSEARGLSQDRDWLDSTGTCLKHGQCTRRCIRQPRTDCDRASSTCAVLCFWIIDYFAHYNHFSSEWNSWRQRAYAERTARFAAKLFNHESPQAKLDRLLGPESYAPPEGWDGHFGSSDQRELFDALRM